MYVKSVHIWISLYVETRTQRIILYIFFNLKKNLKFLFFLCYVEHSGANYTFFFFSSCHSLKCNAGLSANHRFYDYDLIFACLCM